MEPADAHLVLRRTERQQRIVERLVAVRGTRVPLRALAEAYGVAVRTVARDVERLRLSGVPLDVRAGRGGGVSLATDVRAVTVSLDVGEVAALLSCLTSLGPSSTDSAASAMRVLVAALAPPDRSHRKEQAASFRAPVADARQPSRPTVATYRTSESTVGRRSPRPT